IISRILKYKNLSTYKKKALPHKLQRKEFEHNWEISCNYITTKYIDNKRRYLYKIILREISSGIEFVGFTYERSNLSIGIFTDYILYNLKTAGIKTKDIIINAPKSSVFSNIKSNKDTFLDNILNIKYKAKLTTTKKNNIPNSDLCKNNNFCLDEIKTSNELIKYAFTGILQNNLNILSTNFGVKDKNIKSLLIPPIIVDDFINDIDAIKNFDHYWHSLSQPEVRDNILNEVLTGLKQIGDLNKGNYENEKALNLYDKIIATLQYTKKDNKKLRMTVFYKKGEIYQLTGDYSNAIKQLEHSLELAEHIDEYDTIADSSYLLGDLFKVTQSNNNYDEYYNKALTATKSTDNKIIKYYKTMGIIYSRQLNFMLALNNFNTMLEESKKQNDDLNYSTALQLIGETYKNMSLFKDALECFTERIEIEIELDDMYRLMELYNSLALVNYELENYDVSLKYFNMQLELAIQIGDKGSLAIAYKKIADINFNILKNNKLAINNYLNALNIFDEIDDKVNKCMTLILISIVYKRSENFRKAISLLNKAKTISSSINNHYVQCCTEGQLGSIYFYQNKLERSLDSFLVQESIARDNNFNSLLANSSKFISYIYLTMKRYARADIYDTEAKKIYSVLNQRYGESEIKKDFIHQEDDYLYLTENY
nr:tetratricopeptide repeat protein [Candidatus Delongbacteria bacterium]